MRRRSLIAALLTLTLAGTLLGGCSQSDIDPSVIVGEMETEETVQQETTLSAFDAFWTVETLAPEGEEGSVQFPYDYTVDSFFSMNECWEYTPLAVGYGVLEDGSHFHLKAEDGYRVHQGACSDGTYGYFVLANPSQNIDGVTQDICYMYKVDLSTWEVVQRSDTLYIQHANGICYNPRTNQIISANMKPDGNTLSIIDPETLTLVDTVTVYREISAITYNEERNQYVVRLTGAQGFDFAILDENFELVAEYSTVDSLLGIQNIFCDENYIYRLDSGCAKRPGTEGIVVYDWEGNHVGVYRIVLNNMGVIQRNVDETESLFYHDGSFYISFNDGAGGHFYRLELDLDDLIW